MTFEKELNRKMEAQLIREGYQFDENRSTGTVFVRVRDGHVEKVLVQFDGIARRYKPFKPNKYERQIYFGT